MNLLGLIAWFCRRPRADRWGGNSVEVDVIPDWPPNIAKIRLAFPLDGNEIFAWDGAIYVPSGNPPTPELIEHEIVHFRQQDGNPARWWRRYLKDPAFRLEQELEAHQREYQVFCRRHKDRNQRARYLNMLARRMAAPMYGGMITVFEAKRRIGGEKVAR